MNQWEYEPVPRHFFYLGDILAAEIIFDGIQPHSCNEWSDHGEVWRVIIGDYLLGRFATLHDAKDAARKKVITRGLTLVEK